MTSVRRRRPSPAGLAMCAYAGIWLSFLPQTSANASDATVSPSEQPLALIGGTLIDGNGGPPILDSIIVVAGRRISAVGARGAVQVPDSAIRVDISGQWVMPGLVDAHVHFFESGRIFTKPGELNLTQIVTYEDEVRWMKARVPETLARYLCAGVTSAVSMGGPRFELEVRQAARTLERAPNIFVAQGPISAASIGHDNFPLVDGDESTRYAADAVGAQARVLEGIQQHVDLIKAGYLGGPFAQEERHFFELLPAIVATAHSAGLPVAMHATELVPARKAMLAGVDTLAHTVVDKRVDQAFIKAAAALHINVVSTLAYWTRDIQARSGHVTLLPIESRCGDPEVIETWSKVPTLAAVPSKERGEAAQAQKVGMDNLRRLQAAGVAIAVGSDAGNFGLLHGASVHQEMALLALAGMRPADIIVAATRNGARVAGAAGEIGTLEPGKLADLLVLERDPLISIGNVGAISQVMKGGRLFSRDALMGPAKERVVLDVGATKDDLK